MIKRLQLLRNVGQFDSVSDGANIPLSRVSLFYSENGRGKTTLAAIFRSLATGNPLSVMERQRLGAQHPPHVVIECDGGPSPAMLQGGAWSRSLPHVVVFDDIFVDENVYSGLSVYPSHRQKLHEWILGADAVALSKELDELVRKIEEHNKELRTKERAIPAKERGPFGAADFCALSPQAGVNEAIEAAERSLAAAREQDSIRTTPSVDVLNLPEFDVSSLVSLLDESPLTIDPQTLARVGEHLAQLGGGGEEWVADGMRRAPGIDRRRTGPCPFCAQDLSASPVIEHYAAYFSDAYGDFKKRIATTRALISRSHDGNAQAGFERAVRILVERLRFWSRFCKVPDVEVDTASVVRDWRAAWEAVDDQLKAKQSAPLARHTLTSATKDAISAYGRQREALLAIAERIAEANDAIALTKEQVASANVSALVNDLSRLQAVRARQEPEVAALCQEYLDERVAKALTEQRRDQVKVKLEQHRQIAFPNHENAVNAYLAKFYAGFRLTQMSPADSRGGATCTYSVLINQKSVAIGAAEPAPGTPSFRNTLSAGDRNTLALAFFFASLDLDPNLGGKVVVIDDPISSLDEHRTLTTAQEIRRLADRSKQVIVLSHNKAFLMKVWEKTDPNSRAAVEVVRDGAGSSLRVWDVASDQMTEHDRLDSLLREFLASGVGNLRTVARAIRPYVEGALRIRCPEQFPADALLGPFLSLCDVRLGTPREVLPKAAIDELKDLNEYASRYHHQGWETEPINDQELRGFVERAMRFVRGS